MMFTARVLTNIAMAAGEDGCRRCLDCVLLSPASGLSVATDAVIIAVAPVLFDGKPSAAACAVHKSVFSKPTRKRPCVITCSDVACNEKTGAAAAYQEGGFPNVTPHLETAAEYADNSIRLTLDAQHLLRLAKAINIDGNTQVTLAINRDDPVACERPVGVTGTIGVGVIMPLRDPKTASVSVKLRRAVSDLEASCEEVEK